jgi:hypothetical protein
LIIEILDLKKKQQMVRLSNRISNKDGLIVEANGIEDIDAQMTLSVKLNRKRHTTQKDVQYEADSKSKCCK